MQTKSQNRSQTTPCSLLCGKGYYTVRYGGEYQTMRIRRGINGLLKHNYCWETEAEWLSRKPAKIERPTLWDRISNFL